MSLIDCRGSVAPVIGCLTPPLEKTSKKETTPVAPVPKPVNAQYNLFSQLIVKSYGTIMMETDNSLIAQVCPCGRFEAIFTTCVA